MESDEAFDMQSSEAELIPSYRIILFLPSMLYDPFI